MIKIWGRPTSICTQRALWALVETQQPYELTLASATMGPAGHVSKGGPAYGVVDTPAYRAMNPNGTVPTIDDGGFVLWESNAIALYLAAKYAPRQLYADDAATLARASQWMAWTNEHLEPPLHTLVMQLVRLPPADRNPAEAEMAKRAIEKPLAILDTHLGRQPFVAGPAFTIGDIPVGCAVHRWMSFIADRPRLANIEAWHGRLATRPGFAQHVTPAEFHTSG
jgi:glutathione S-transferase